MVHTLFVWTLQPSSLVVVRWLIIHIFTYLIKFIQLLLHFQKNSNTHIGPCFYILFYHSNVPWHVFLSIAFITSSNVWFDYLLLLLIIWISLTLGALFYFWWKIKGHILFVQVWLVQQVISLLVKHIHVHDCLIPFSPNL
jgi:hypothetical protein